MRSAAPPLRRQRGYALLLAILAVAMGTLYAVVSQLEHVTRRYARGEGGMQALALAREALLGYAATYRDSHDTEVFGYLPCPDLSGDGNAAAACGAGGQAAVGLLPYKSLGLPDLRDADGVCLWYAVSGAYKNNPKNAATPLNWDTHGQFGVVDAAGTALATPDQGDGGAAAVVFAASAPVGGQGRGSTTTGACGIDPAAVADYLDGNYVFATTAPILLTQGTLRDAAGNASRNDRLAWITPKEIFDKVVRRADFANPRTATPPGQINRLADQIRSKLEKAMQDDLATGGSVAASRPANLALYLQPAGRQVGDLGNLTPLVDAGYDDYFAHWSEQFRQVVCSPLVGPCLAINGTPCRGALLLGGRGAGGRPRSAAQKVPSTANLDHYFEAGSGRDLLASAATSFSGNTEFSAAAPAADAASCLFPGSFVSFAQDSGSLAAGTVGSAGGGNPVAAVTPASKSVRLGSSVSGTGTARSGCTWFPTPLPMGELLRVYFRYQVVARGRGFALVLADAGTNDPADTAPVMCGATGNTSLGYAGAPPTGQASFGGSSAAIATVGWSADAGGLATVTTVAAHGFVTGNNVAIGGVLPAGYNGTHAVTRLNATQFRYALANDPGPPPAGIRPPKLAVEFDTMSNGALLDPGGNHFAFVYWGGADDSVPAGSGGDDNTHYGGILGSGAEPLNPRETGSATPTATPIADVTAAAWSGGVVTATTAGPHGFVVGHNVRLAGLTATAYRGTHTVTAVPDATHFSYTLADNPGVYSHGTHAGRTATVANVSAGLITAVQAHGFAVGDTLNLSGFGTAVGCNGSYRVATVPGSTQLTLTAYSPTCGTGFATLTHPVAAATWANGIATVTTTAAHNLATGQYVSLSDLHPGGYNGSHAVTVINATRFSIALATDPGGSHGAGATPGIATVASLSPTHLSSGPNVPLTTVAAPYNSDTPQNGVIHVRLDIARRHSAGERRATLRMRAYVADSFGNYDAANTLYNTCTVAEFKDLSRELTDLCTQGAALSQDGIVVGDVGDPALAKVYLGFTTARGTAAGDDQNIVVSNLLTRAQ
ncbi:MAG: hypothetical protein OEL88_08370 [Sterolibacteriaceae bacterium MAG5]|nr:hypothetical protein [Candidatus Nitricoxidireducens bremensis]